MKKALAIFLSALLVCISLAPMSFAVSDPGLTTRVFEGKYDSAAKGVSAITKTTFTIAVKVPAVKKLVGVNMYFSFDPAVLSVVEANIAGYYDAEENYNKYFNGMDVTGFKTDSGNSQYSFGWVSDNGVTKTSAKDFAYITFAVLDTTKTNTSVNLYVDEFRTDDNDDTNDVTSTLLVENKVINFSFPEETPPETTPDTTAENGSTTTPSDINGLIQIIRDMLSGNGATFGDFVDAIANLLGNADIADMIEMIVDDDIDISEFFQNILDGLGLDFGSLEDILNKIIDFFKSLFGGDDKPSTTSVATTEAVDASDDVTESVEVSSSEDISAVDTTSGGSGSSSEKTGDVGVGIAAAVCVMASAAFVLTRKKKETV